MSQTAAVEPARAPGLAEALRNMVRPRAAEIESDIDFTAAGGARLGRDVGVFDPVRLARFDAFTRVVVLVVTALTLSVAAAKGMRIEFGDTRLALVIAAFMASAAVVYGGPRPAPRLAAGAAMLAELLYYGVIFIVFSYVMMSCTGAERAPLMARFDAALGFDWIAYTGWLSSFPTLLDVMRECYTSIAWQDFIVPTCLLLWGRLGWLRIFMNGFALGATLTMAVAILVPAIDARAFYTLDLSDTSRLVTGFHLTDDYLRLRDGRLTTVNIDQITGIISFPSFHTYLALLFLVAAWPLRKLWWCLLPVNLLLIASTPKFGFHYLADVFGGVVVAAIVLGFSLAFLRVRPAPRPA